MHHSKEMMNAKQELEEIGFTTEVPRNTKYYANDTLAPESRHESTENKIKGNVLKRYYNLIKESDGILVGNLEKHGIHDYIGGNTFLEMAFAHILDKPIYLQNPIPEISYKDELIAMQPIIINGDFSKIK